MIRIKKGLDLPLTGSPRQAVDAAPSVKRVAILGSDYPGMKPTLLVKEGDSVSLGQVLFTDKKNEGVNYTSPGAGVVEAIHRGEKRAFVSLVISLSGDAQETFEHFPENGLATLDREKVKANLVKSGLWTAIRRRPYGVVPQIKEVPHSIFVSAMDTNPHAPDPQIVLQDRGQDFRNGLKVLSRLTDGKLFLTRAAGASIPGTELDCVTVGDFSGPHPAGLVGTHIHYLDPVVGNKVVWHVGYQDVVSIGKLFTSGKLDLSRTISIAGPACSDPCLIQTRLGACVSDLAQGRINEGEEVRLISGSVLFGNKADGPTDFLGRRHYQLSMLREGREREFMGWHMPGVSRFSVKNVFVSKMVPFNSFALTTNRNGSERDMVPIGSFEQVMPLRMIPTYLLRSMLSDDAVMAQELGCMELEEEDLALCTFVCPGKMDYGPVLRKMLTQIEKEG